MAPGYRTPYVGRRVSTPRPPLNEDSTPNPYATVENRFNSGLGMVITFHGSRVRES